MSFVMMPGQGITVPDVPILANTSYAFTTSVIDATGEKFAFIGSVFNKDRATKSITKIGFRPGTVVSAGGSGVTISLQNVDLVNGPPARPDGTQDQTVSFLLSALTSNTWYQTAALSASRSVAFGEQIAIVFEFDGSGRLGADSLQISGLTQSFAGTSFQPASSLYTTSWAAVALLANVILEFTDGTFGTLQGGFPLSGTVAITDFDSTSTPDERALRFKVNHKCKIDGGWFSYYTNTPSHVDICLYNGTTLLASITVDPQTLAIGSAVTKPVYFLFGAEYELNTTDTYYLSIKPTGTTAGERINMSVFTVSAANHLQAHQGGVDFYHAYRTDAGAWTTVATERPLAGLSISSLDDGNGAGRASLSIGI